MKTYLKSDYSYTPLFCEENIWQLASSMIRQGVDPESLNILLLSNPDKTIAIFNQLVAKNSEAVIWDYHVILSLEVNKQAFIFDFDSRLNFPVRQDEYFLRSFPPDKPVADNLHAWVRNIPAASFLKHFHSDRSHMQGVIPETDYPNYPIITPIPGNRVIDLSDYWNMEKELNDGSTINKRRD